MEPCLHSGLLPKAFPLKICIVQTIKYWRWEWPGNKAISQVNRHQFIKEHFISIKY